MRINPKNTRLLAATLLLVTASAQASAEEAGWQPPPPMPDEFDWVQTTSLEWLKGEIIAMYDGALEFDSDEFDMQTIDWDDVKEIRSAGTMQVGFENDAIAVGRIFVDDETVRIMGDEDLRFPRTDVLSIIAGEPKEKNYWSIKASLGANLRRGNSEQVETTSKATIVRRTPKDRINMDFLGTFNRTDGNTAADNQRASAGWNHYISKRFYWSPVYGEWYRDPFANIAQRWTLGMGLGYEIIDTSKITWDVNGGLAYQATTFESVEEGENESASTPSLVVGTVYDHELTGWMDYVFDYRFYIVNQDSGTYTHHLLTGFELELTRILDLDISFIWDRTQNPQPEADGVVPKKDDYRLVLFVGFDF
jgi:hypothetical protein